MAQTELTDTQFIADTTSTKTHTNRNIQKSQPSQSQSQSHCTEANNINNIPHSYSLTSLSSISSNSSSFHNHCTNDNEIYENVSHECYAQKILINTTPSPKRQSPSASPSASQRNNHNTKPSILSTLTTLHTNNLTTRPLSPSPHEPHSQIQHQNVARKHLKHENNSNVDRRRTRSRSSISSLRRSIWSKYKQINNYINPHSNNAHSAETEAEQKKVDESCNNAINDIIHSQAFMDGAFTMYHKLDSTLTNINNLKQAQLKEMQSFADKRKEHTRNISQNEHAQQPDTPDSNEEKQAHPQTHAHNVDVNGHISEVMQTLIASTTEMGAFFTNSNGIASPNDNGDGDGGPSLIGSLLDRLSSSIAYMSYISVSTVTPFLYNMVEAVLLELYSTINDIIEYYDPDPKNNILWRLINKMNEIIEAIRGLLALSDCFYEISSDNDERGESSYSFFKKEKQD